MKKILLPLLAAILIITGCNQNLEQSSEKSSKEEVKNEQKIVEEELTLEETKDNSKENFSEANSEDEIDFKGENYKWRLTNSVDPDRTLIYEGENIITGWIVYKPRYVGQAEPHFHSAINDFPEYFGTDFYLTMYSEKEQKEAPIPENILQRLGEYSEDNPAKILVNKIQNYSEMTPTMNLVEIVE